MTTATATEAVSGLRAVYTPKVPKRCCITGPKWVGPNYFNHFYAPLIDKELVKDDETEYLLGDEIGIDTHSQKYLAERGAFDRVTVYIKKGTEPRLVDKRFKVNDDAKKYPERDILMSERANCCIAVLPQFGNLTTGATLPVYKQHTGAHLKPLPLPLEDSAENPLSRSYWQNDSSHLLMLLTNLTTEYAPISFFHEADQAASSALRDALIAQKILQVLRMYSEPEDVALTTTIGLIYEIWYAPPGADTSELQKALLAMLANKAALKTNATDDDGAAK